MPIVQKVPKAPSDEGTDANAVADDSSYDDTGKLSRPEALQ